MNKNDNYLNIGESVKNLKHIYKKTTYFKSYGTSIFLFIFITLIFFLFFSYFNIKNNVHKYKSDPAKYRCDPSVMPFAGHIFPHPGMTNSQFNRSNIMYCMREVLKDMLGEILRPFEYIAQLMQNIHSLNFGSLNFLRTLFSDIRNALSGIFGLLFNLLKNLFASINNIIVYLSDSVIKSITLVLSGVYVSNLLIYCIRIIAKFTLFAIIEFLLILSSVMIAIFTAVFIAVFGAFIWLPFGLGFVIAPILSWVSAIAVVSGFVVIYIIITVVFSIVAHAIEIGLDVTADEAPQPVPEWRQIADDLGNDLKNAFTPRRR
jgi:hypothetical protein